MNQRFGVVRVSSTRAWVEVSVNVRLSMSVSPPWFQPSMWCIAHLAAHADDPGGGGHPLLAEQCEVLVEGAESSRPAEPETSPLEVEDLQIQVRREGRLDETADRQPVTRVRDPGAGACEEFLERRDRDDGRGSPAGPHRRAGEHRQAPGVRAGVARGADPAAAVGAGVLRPCSGT
ncbi:hypothetical protein ACFWIF_02430, partial [Corynebacterium bovis]|uniref:hypothetical protein n=1 Tax=Corynebacterium bovis TaxID=36808 RepID=UPI00369E0751